MVYWANAANNLIARGRMDGTGSSTILWDDCSYRPYDVALDIASGWGLHVSCFSCLVVTSVLFLGETDFVDCFECG